MNSDGIKFRSNIILQLLLIQLVLLVGCGDSLDGVPPGTDPYMGQRAYFPVHLGNSWTYTVGDTIEYTYTIVDHHALRDGDSAWVRVSGEGDEIHQSYYWKNELLLLNETGDSEVNKAYLKIPVHLGSQWDVYNYELGGLRRKAVARIVSEAETVEVPAGVFENSVVIEIVALTVSLAGDTIVAPDTLLNAYALDVGILYWKHNSGIEYLLKEYNLQGE